MRRYSTREPRVGDAADGLTTIDWQEFRRRADGDEFALAWKRPLGDGSRIGYGCAHPDVGRVGLFMAGHGIYTNPGSVRPSLSL